MFKFKTHKYFNSQKLNELKYKDLDEDAIRAIDHIERVTRYTAKLEELEKKTKIAHLTDILPKLAYLHPSIDKIS